MPGMVKILQVHLNERDCLLIEMIRRKMISLNMSIYDGEEVGGRKATPTSNKYIIQSSLEALANHLGLLVEPEKEREPAEAAE